MEPYSLKDIHESVPHETAVSLVAALNGAFNRGFIEGTRAPKVSDKHVTVQYRLGESSAVVQEVLKFIEPARMNGLDIGSGGSPIFPQSISMDISRGFLGSLIQVHGDAKDLSLFSTASLDYVFSSHCWEDFTEEEKPVVIDEWMRVIKKGGFLILLLPDEKRYRACCARDGTGSNPNHKDAEFGLEKTRAIVQSRHEVNTGAVITQAVEEVFCNPFVGEYSFLIVYRRL